MTDTYRWHIFNVGDSVIKESGDYTFEGEIVAIFMKKKNGAVRYVVEDARGILLIMNETQLQKSQ